MWFPAVLLHCHFDGKPTRSGLGKHGNRTTSNIPHIRTMERTRSKAPVAAEKLGPKGALLQARKEADGICTVDSICSRPRNRKQLEYLSGRPAEQISKDLLAAVLELQKTTFSGFICEVVCNDLTTVMLFIDRQFKNIAKFCCHSKVNQVSELRVDVVVNALGLYVTISRYQSSGKQFYSPDSKRRLKDYSKVTDY